MGLRPVACCRTATHLRPASRNERRQYGLPDIDWWRCEVCWRFHPYDPSSDKANT